METDADDDEEENEAEEVHISDGSEEEEEEEEEGEEERWEGRGDQFTVLTILSSHGPRASELIQTNFDFCIYVINHKRLCAGTFRTK